MKVAPAVTVLFLAAGSLHAENGIQQVSLAASDVVGQKTLVNEIKSWRIAHLENSPAQQDEFKPILDQIEQEAEAAQGQAAFERVQGKFQNWKIAFLRRKYNSEPATVRNAHAFPIYAADAVNRAEAARKAADVAERNGARVARRTAQQEAAAAAIDRAREQSNQQRFQTTQALAANPNALFEGLAAHRALNEYPAAQLPGPRVGPTIEAAAALAASKNLPAVLPVIIHGPSAAVPPSPAQGAPDFADPFMRVRQHLVSGGVNANIVDQIIKESVRQGVDPRFALAVVANESHFNPHATSDAGAGGLFQIMPKTFKWLNRFTDANLLYDMNHNIRSGVKYLKSLWGSFVGGVSDLARLSLDRVNSDSDIENAIAAFNAGPGNVRKHGGVPPFPETQAYVPRVLRTLRQYLSL
jgi:soluble lytic murein transglycosylase-like protein